MSLSRKKKGGRGEEGAKEEQIVYHTVTKFVTLSEMLLPHIRIFLPHDLLLHFVSKSVLTELHISVGKLFQIFT